MKKERQSNIEILRIVAMLFVIMLHYLGKGGALLPWGNEAFSVNTWLAWAIQAFALVAVNVYVLISGYFLVESRFQITRIIKLWLQIFFYSAGVWLIFLIFDMVPADYTGGYWVSMFLLPVTSSHYWFGGTYIFLCLLSPFLSVAVKAMSKTQLKTCIIVLLLLFSRVWRIILPMSSPIDDRGYGIIWFVCLFMIAAYIRLYVPVTGKWLKPLMAYVISSLALFLTLPTIGFVTHSIGKMEQYYNVFYEYNAPFTIVGAVALFLAFLNIKNCSAKPGRFINRLAGATFGVYLLHEHVLLRPLWTTLWDVPAYYQTPYFILHLIVVVVLVYLAGSLVDLLRQGLFYGAYKLIHLDKISRKLAGINKLFDNNKEKKSE